jgi:hypothetical protein
MKKLFLPATLLFLCISAEAQIGPRLVGRTYRSMSNTTLNISDSASMSYSGNRTLGKFEEDFGEEVDEWLYDHSKSYRPQGAPGSPMQLSDVEYRTFDNNNNITSFIYASVNGSQVDTSSKVQIYYTNNKIDSAIVYDKDGNGVWEINGKYLLKRDAQLRITEKVEVGTDQNGNLENHSRTIYTYNGSHKATEETQDWIANAWEPFELITYTYTGNNLTSELTQGYDGTSWEDEYMETYTYDAKGNMIESLSQEWNSSTTAWENGNKTINTYDAQDNLVTKEMQQWDMGTGSFRNQGRVTYTYDNNHNELTNTYENWTGSAYVGQKKTTKTYNTANLISSEMTETWNASSNKFEMKSGDYKINYYYDISVSVRDAKSAKANMLLYPNPATNSLNIEMKNKDNQPFSFTIYDVMGKAVKHWNEIGVIEYSKAIDISDLASGNYYLRCSNNLQSMQQFSIVK